MFTTDDIQAAWKELKAKGVDAADIQVLPYGKMFSFKDNEDNRYLIRN